MKTVIGLFSKDEYVECSLHKLKEIGIPLENIQILIYENNVRELLDGQQGQVVTHFAGLGILFSAVIFGLYDLIGLICNCGFPIYGLQIELDKLALFIVVGAALGMLGGYFLGVERLDGSSRLYIWNVQQGSIVMAVQIDDELVETIINILHQESGVAIKTLESRFGQFLNKKSRPAFF